MFHALEERPIRGIRGVPMARMGFQYVPKRRDRGTGNQTCAPLAIDAFGKNLVKSPDFHDDATCL